MFFLIIPWYLSCPAILVSSTASSKTISGLLEFDSKTEAVEVLTVLNHYQIRIPSKSSSEVFWWLQHMWSPRLISSMSWMTMKLISPWGFFPTCVLFQMGPIHTPWSCAFPPHLIYKKPLSLLVADAWSGRGGESSRGSAVDPLLRWKKMEDGRNEKEKREHWMEWQ